MNALKNIADQLRPRSQAAGYGLIGAHFSRSRLHLVQLQRDRSGSVALSAHASEPLATDREQIIRSPAAVKTVLRRALKQASFRGKRVITTMPREYVRLISISYPAVAPEAEAATIAGLMADRVAGNLSDYVIDYVPVRTSVRDGERLCMVAVSRRDDVLPYLDALAGAGLTVEALEVSPLSLRRLVASMSSPDNIENTLVIDIARESTHLTLLSGRRLLATQGVEFGTDPLIELVSTSLGVPNEVARDLLARNGLGANAPETGGADSDTDIGHTILEIVKPRFLKLVDAIERAFLYASSESYGQANKRIYLFGDMERWTGADELLCTLTKLPVHILNTDLLPFATDGNDMDGSPCPGGLAIASGLALWELPGDD